MTWLMTWLAYGVMVVWEDARAWLRPHQPGLHLHPPGTVPTHRDPGPSYPSPDPAAHARGEWMQQ